MIKKDIGKSMIIDKGIYKDIGKTIGIYKDIDIDIDIDIGKTIGNVNKNIETTSFLKTIESSEIDNISLTNNIQDKQVDEIVSKYLDLKKKINLLWNKID